MMLLATVLAALLSPLSVSVTPEMRTAYQSRGKIVEDRAIASILARVEAETGCVGRFGFWHWNGSSLTRRRQDVHRRPFNELDWGVSWRYDYAFDEARTWRLSTEVLKDWVTSPGYTDAYHAKKSDASINEIRIGQALENPYVTPFYLMRRAFHPAPWLYWQVGARRKFTFLDDFSFTPSYFLELGNGVLQKGRYGARVDGGAYGPAGMASNLRFEIGYALSEWCTVFACVHQFDIISQRGRRAVKASSANNARRDLTIGTVGLRLKF